MATFGPFHHLTSPDVVAKILESGELWGKAPGNYFRSDIEKVKAYLGPLPDGQEGVEFETDVPPDYGCVPDKPTWATKPRRPGIKLEDGYAKIKVRVLRHSVILR